MRKYLKEIAILLFQLLIFYISPLFAKGRSAIGMVLLIILATVFFSFVIGILSNNKIKYLYPIIVALLFIPSVFIYYNESALIHSVWYFVVSSVGLSVGAIIHNLTYKKTDKGESI